jgi:MYXO-CTERM domain-containing protein
VSDPNAAVGRFRLASPANALALTCLVLALVAAQWPLAALAHQSVNTSSGGPPWWAVAPGGLVGFVVARRRPRNPLGWCLGRHVMAHWYHGEHRHHLG